METDHRLGVRYGVTESFYDREAEREVNGFTRSVMFRLWGSSQCVERGVGVREDGTVYTLTARRHGHADTVSGRHMIATQMRAGSEFGKVARDLVEFESPYIPGDRITSYREHAQAL